MTSHHQNPRCGAAAMIAVVGIGGILLGALLVATSVAAIRRSGSPKPATGRTRMIQDPPARPTSASQDAGASQTAERLHPERQRFVDEVMRLKPFPWEAASSAVCNDADGSSLLPPDENTAKVGGSRASTAETPVRRSASTGTQRYYRRPSAPASDGGDDVRRLDFLASMTFANGFGMRAPSCPCCQ